MDQLVNVNNFESQKVEGDRLDAVFARQRELMEKYHVIEAENNLLLSPDIPVDIHHRMGQARIKDMMWRMTEELAEAMDAYFNSPEQVHCWEEVADAFHFLIEACILGDVGPEFTTDFLTNGMYHAWPENEDKLDELYQLAIEQRLGLSVHENFTTMVTSAGMTCHTLKNKPWKKSHMLTDVVLFKHRLRKTLVYFMCFARSLGMNADQLFDLYFRKSEVNKFRQRSQY